LDRFLAVTLYRAKGFGQNGENGFTGGRLLAFVCRMKGNTPGRPPARHAAAPGVTRAYAKKAPANSGQGMKKPGLYRPRLFCFTQYSIYHVPGTAPRPRVVKRKDSEFNRNKIRHAAEYLARLVNVKQ
jgi:hypothetical protein